MSKGKNPLVGITSALVVALVALLLLSTAVYLEMWNKTCELESRIALMQNESVEKERTIQKLQHMLATTPFLYRFWVESRQSSMSHTRDNTSKNTRETK